MIHRRTMHLWAVLGALAMGALGCVATGSMTAVPEHPTTTDYYVRALNLSRTIGYVGKRFKSRLSYQDNYFSRGQYSVEGLPPGLSFDKTRREIVGVPTRPGFYDVNIAVRRKPSDALLSRTTPEDRWWPREFELRIYKPMR